MLSITLRYLSEFNTFSLFRSYITNYCVFCVVY